MADNAATNDDANASNRDDPLRTRPEVGRQLGGASAERVQRLIEAGKLYPAYRIGGRVVIPQSAVDDYLDRCRIDHRPAPVPMIGGGLFYDTGLHLVAGSSNCGATWLALAACIDAVPAVQLPDNGPHAVYVHTGEDHEFPARLRELGLSHRAANRDDVALMDVDAEAAKRGEDVIVALRRVIEALTSAPPRVVVIDSLPELAAKSWSKASDAEVIELLAALSETSCVIVLDTVNKQGQLRGSTSKLNAARAVLMLEPDAVDSAEQAFSAEIVSIAKDRDGGLRGGRLLIGHDERDDRVEVRFTPAETATAA